MNPNSQTANLAAGGTPQIVERPLHDEVDMTALVDEWKQSRDYVEQYTRDFKDLDNLVDGISINAQKGAPLVGDTTLAGLVRSIPRDSLQQLPVFSVAVNGTKNSIPAYICTYLLRRYTFNDQTFGKGLLSTLQLGAEQALTHGYAPFMVAMASMYNRFGTSMKLLHWSDTAPERGITDASDSGFHYVVANLTPGRVRKIRDQAMRTPNTAWNVDALNEVLQTTPAPTNYSIYESSQRQNTSGENSGQTYKFITRYDVGDGAASITFCPDVPSKPLRVLESKSKWGYPRVQYLVIDPAALTPFGTSRVRLAAPNQNLMNIYYGNIASMLLLNSKPPIFKRGRFIKPVELKQGAVWESNDPNATAELKNLDNGSLEFFPQMAQQFSSQISNIMGKTTGQLNGNGGTFGFSKTGPGVKQQNAVEDLSTNQITKILENFLRQYALSGLDVLLSENEGTEVLIVDDECKNNINDLVPGSIGDDNKFEITWERFYEAIEEWAIDIEVSLSKDQMEEKKRGDAQDMLTVLTQNLQALGPDGQLRVKQLTDELMQDLAPNLKQPAAPAGGMPQPAIAAPAPAAGVPGAAVPQ